MKLLFTLILITGLCSAGVAQNLPSLSAVYDKSSGAVKLRWQHNDESITGYALQRSSDNNTYTDIVSKSTDNIAPGSFLNFTDGKSSSGKNYYRLKIFRRGYSYEATIPVIVMTTDKNDNGWIIYPVPVGSVLNLQYKGSGPVTGVIGITIQSVSSGTIFTKMRCASTARNIQIPVDNLGNGLYDIHVYIGSEPVWNQRFVK